MEEMIFGSTWFAGLEKVQKIVWALEFSCPATYFISAPY